MLVHFEQNKGDLMYVHTLGVNGQAPGNSHIQKFGKSAGYGIDEPWSVA